MLGENKAVFGGEGPALVRAGEECFMKWPVTCPEKKKKSDNVVLKI